MTSFMGPMAPPPPAQPQPQALDIRTNPNQRQQFKQFMKQRTSMMPMTSAPIAQPPMMPMMQPPMPMPMGQDIDIFSPVNLHEGGIVPSLNSLQQQAAQFAQQLQGTVMGSGSGGSMGGGMVGGMSGGGFGGAPSASINPSPTNPLKSLPNLSNLFSPAPNNPADYANPTIDQGFYESDIFKNLDLSGQQTRDYRVPSEATGGFAGSSSVIGKLNDAYQQYLQGQQGGAAQSSGANPFFGSGQQPVSYGLPGGPTYGFEDGGAVPPRNTDIQGQPHMLSYITPDEADILMALGGSGESGPMGIPAFFDVGEGYGGYGSGDQDDATGGAGDPDAGIGGGGLGDPSGGGISDDGGSDADEIGDALGLGDVFGGYDESDSDADEISDALADIAAAEIAGQMADDRAAARDRAIRDAFVTDSRGVPIGTPGSPSGRFGGNLGKTGVDQDTVDRALDALAGVPGSRENLAAAAAAAQEASFGAPAGIAAVTDPLSSSNKNLGLLGIDLDFQYSPPAQTNVNLSRNPRSGGFIGKQGPIDSQAIQAIDELSFGPPAPGGGLTQGQIDNFAERGLVTDVAPSSIDDFDANLADLTGAIASAPSSNVVSDFSPTPADQLADVYGIDLDALNAAVDDPNAAIGARGPAATDARAGIGYDPVTDMPYGLEFATNPQTGAQITTNLAGLTEQQQKDQPFSMDVAQFVGSNPYGYEIDPQTGRVIGQVGTPPFGILGGLTTLAQNLFMGPPQTTQDLIERGVYTGMTGQDNLGGGQSDDQQIKSPNDPCPDGFVMKNGACTPIDTGSDVPNMIGGIGTGQPPPPPAPVIVPSPRSNFPGYSLQGPVGYGSPIAGQMAPSVASNAALYQQMLNQQAMRPPLRLEDGGPVIPRKFEDGGAADEISNFYRVPSGRKIYIGSAQDTMENRIAGSSDLASALQGTSPGVQAVNQAEYMEQFYKDLAALQGRPSPIDIVADPVPDPQDPVIDDGIITDPAPPDPAPDPIMDVIVPSTRLEDFPASAPPASILPMQNMQPMPTSSISPVVSSTRPTGPMMLQGPVGYGSSIAGQGPGNISPLISNALNFQNMLSQPFPMKLQQGGPVSSNLDRAADNFLKALMPAA